MLIPVRKITWILIGVMLLLDAAHLWVNLAPPVSPTGFRYDSLISAFHLENEANIPNWYSTVLLFAIALAALVIRRLQKQPRWGFFWPVFAGFFALLSLEEAADLREVIYHTIFVKSFLVCAPLGVIFISLCLGFFFFIRRTDGISRLWIGAGLFLLLVGALGGQYLQINLAVGQNTFAAGILIKETLEMLGEILVLAGCLMEINTLAGEKMTMDFHGR